MYCTAMKKHIIDNTSYKTCLQLLKFLSKDDILAKFDKVINFLLLLFIFDIIFINFTSSILFR